MSDAPPGNLAKRVLVLLVHGIRTQAEWQSRLRQILERTPGCQVVPLSFGFFDTFSFLSPFFTRWLPIKSLLWRIEDATKGRNYDELVIVAHSFGTYAITKILSDKPSILPTRLLFCGSIVNKNFRWDRLPNRCPTVNDCGTRDIWPVLAHSVTWGYGTSGVFGFGTSGVQDRYHDFSHSDFFATEFVEKYWVPWICRGEYVSSPHDTARGITPYWISLLGFLKLKYVVPAISLAPLALLLVIFPPFRTLVVRTADRAIAMVHPKEPDAAAVQSTWDISLSEFLNQFQKVRNDDLKLEAFKKEHVGQKVIWSATVIGVLRDNDVKSLTIGKSIDAAMKDRIVANFVQGAFPEIAMIGDVIGIEGVFDSLTNQSGAVIRGCRRANLK